MSAALSAIDQCFEVLYGRAPRRTPAEVHAFHRVEDLRSRLHNARTRKERSDAEHALAIAQQHLAEIRMRNRPGGNLPEATNA